MAPLSQHSTPQLSDHTGTHRIAGGHLCCRNLALHTGSQFSVLATGSCQHLSPHISCLSPRCIGASKLVHICHHLVCFLACKFNFKQLLVKWHGKFQTSAAAAAAAAAASAAAAAAAAAAAFLSKCLSKRLALWGPLGLHRTSEQFLAPQKDVTEDSHLPRCDGVCRSFHRLANRRWCPRRFSNFATSPKGKFCPRLWRLVNQCSACPDVEHNFSVANLTFSLELASHLTRRPGLSPSSSVWICVNRLPWLCSAVSYVRRFEMTYCFQTKARGCFETSETTAPTTQGHMPSDATAPECSAPWPDIRTPNCQLLSRHNCSDDHADSLTFNPPLQERN